ncbi:MAG TPA: MFS transporter [Geminicoccaceae bacterium]|nr:MFS transporter [Geminicoccaceae bacterium]
MIQAQPAEATAVPVRSIAFLAAASFVSAATMRVGDPLVPLVSEEFHVTAGEAGIVVTAFAMAYGICQLLWGPLGDRFGKFKLVTVVMLLSVLTVGCAAFTETMHGLALARLVAGAMAAAVIPLSMAFIGDHVPYAQRQPILARFLSGQILGLVFGQVFAGVFADYVGWRGVFVLLAGLYLVVGLLLLRDLLRSRVPPPVLGGRLDPATMAARYLDLCRRPHARLVLLAVAIEGLVVFGSFTFVAAWLRLGYGLNYLVVGGILGFFGLGGLIYAIAASRLVGRLGERGLVTFGGLGVGASFVLLAIDPPLLLVPVVITALGLGFYMMHNTLQVNATQMAPEMRGLAVAGFASVFFIGQALGAWLGGTVVDGAGYAALFTGAAVLIPMLALLFVEGKRRLSLRQI